MLGVIERESRLFAAACLDMAIRAAARRRQDVWESSSYVAYACAHLKEAEAETAVYGAGTMWGVTWILLSSSCSGRPSKRRQQMGSHVADQAGVLVDLVGPGPGIQEIDPAWRTSTVLALAGSIYADKAWGACPVLADALMDAGMPEHYGGLAYLRGPRRKFRGCWILDRILEKR
jgi:hypothetical protein